MSLLVKQTRVIIFANPSKRLSIVQLKFKVMKLIVNGIKKVFELI